MATLFLRLVKALQNTIDVDIYGKCGTYDCERNEVNLNGDHCMKKIEREYKFYFAFENSFCVDYITEKFYSSAMYVLTYTLLTEDT